MARLLHISAKLMLVLQRRLQVLCTLEQHVACKILQVIFAVIAGRVCMVDSHRVKLQRSQTKHSAQNIQLTMLSTCVVSEPAALKAFCQVTAVWCVCQPADCWAMERQHHSQFTTNLILLVMQARRHPKLPV